MTEIEKKESIGERLHKARLKKKVTVDEAYKETKIHPKVLTALEEDRYEEFLSPTYIKAFLKSYCRYLELDANKILEDYDKIGPREQSKVTLQLKGEDEKVSSPKFTFNLDKFLPFNKDLILPVGLGIIGVFVGIALIIFFVNAAINTKDSKASKTKAGAVETRAASSIKKPLSIPQDQPLTLVVRAKDTVWLQVKSDGKTIFQNILKKGIVETYRAENEFLLWTGKGEFLDLSLNGNPLGSPGNGVIRTILLTRQGLQIEKK